MIYIASDHAGFDLKTALVRFLRDSGREVRDMGPETYDPEDDYPDYILPAAEAVAADPGSLGVVIGGSGQGEALAANKVRGVRAALYYGGPREIISLSRTHNNANVLSLGARFISESEAVEVIGLWLETSFSGDLRHERRLLKLREYEERHSRG
ncbi:RpiB/LacA/LacB family sugar-phosphate isomerase [Robiginitalea sp. SC105]|uniref:RpiB/LacA/LacB family sugar-phosphate isomerase n=1 Tax=Robiginitalea sp. SC105 TaxID=2762332 RepID=UPI001639D1C4|nr:RpiB/LacA/LacB family sugar-phosphate isomerase [Robiginitalea sp. SC105]MBC2839529.1 RpiB/LacA/LacB family sugar-phosphate isomerase [Robiginitalea sp. SC105]